MKKHILAAAFATSTFAIAVPAEATIINYSVNGSAGTGSFSLDLTGGVYTLDTVSLTFGTASFNISNTQLANLGSNYCLGTASASGCFVDGSTNSFGMTLDPSLTSQTAGYSIWADGNGGLTGSRNTIITQVAAAVPEPATWAMMLLGFGAIGFALRRRKPAEVLAA